MTHGVLGVLFAGVVVLVTAAPCAADSDIGLSRDGQSWSETLSTPLFDADLRWVPGDVRTASFYVRNQAAGAADLSVDVVGARGDAALRRAVSVSARTPGEAWANAGRPAQGARGGVGVPRGHHVRVDVRVSYDRNSTNQTQSDSVRLFFRVVLSEHLDAQAGHGARLLPSGGSFVSPWMLWAAALMLGTGSALVTQHHGSAGGRQS